MNFGNPSRKELDLCYIADIVRSCWRGFLRMWIDNILKKCLESRLLDDQKIDGTETAAVGQYRAQKS